MSPVATSTASPAKGRGSHPSRTSTRTRCPWLSSKRTTLLPTKPVAPVTRNGSSMQSDSQGNRILPRGGGRVRLQRTLASAYFGFSVTVHPRSVNLQPMRYDRAWTARLDGVGLGGAGERIHVAGNRVDHGGIVRNRFGVSAPVCGGRCAADPGSSPRGPVAALAQELHAQHGVQALVVPADLSQPDACRRS